jgi:hypothetical protein
MVGDIDVVMVGKVQQQYWQMTKDGEVLEKEKKGKGEETINAFNTILEGSPLSDEEYLYSPLKGHSMAFQVKWKTLQKSDAQDIGTSDPFPFLFDRREMAKSQKTLLRNYPADQLMGDELLAVETNVSTYDITNKDSSCHCGHSLSLCCIYFLGN